MEVILRILESNESTSVYLQLGLAVLCSVFTLNSGILTVPKYRTIVPSVATNEDSTASASKKDKRGVFGFGVHGHHGYPQHYDDYVHNHHHQPHHSHHSAPLPPPLPPHHPPATHPVNLGAHFHTTVTKKIGIPIPYPYPVKVCYMIVVVFLKIIGKIRSTIFVKLPTRTHYIR